MCGFLGCDVLPFNPLISALPGAIHLPRAQALNDRLDHLLNFALSEMREGRSGGQCVLLRLSELTFVEVLRRYLDGSEVAQSGWLAGLRDAVVGKALALLHQRPAARSRRWSAIRLRRGARRRGSARTILFAQRRSQIVRKGACGRFRRPSCRKNGMKLQRLHLPVTQHLHQCAAGKFRAAVPQITQPIRTQRPSAAVRAPECAGSWRPSATAAPRLGCAR